MNDLKNTKVDMKKHTEANNQFNVSVMLSKKFLILNHGEIIGKIETVNSKTPFFIGEGTDKISRVKFTFCDMYGDLLSFDGNIGFDIDNLVKSINENIIKHVEIKCSLSTCLNDSFYVSLNSKMISIRDSTRQSGWYYQFDELIPV